MEIKYEVTEEDYIKFNIHHAENSKSRKKEYTMMRYLLAILSGIIIFFIGPSLFNQPKLYWGIGSIIFIIIWIVGFPKEYKKLVRKSVQSMLKDGDNSSMIGMSTMIVGENDIKVINENSTEITSKKGIKEVRVYDDMILIYLSGFTAHVIPTRYLTEESEEELLEKLALLKN